MGGATEIYVSGREYKVPGDLVAYQQIVNSMERTARPGGEAHHRNSLALTMRTT